MLNANDVKILRFGSAKDMHDMLINGAYLYSPNLEILMFRYGFDGSIAFYSTRENRAMALAQRVKDTGLDRGGDLGTGGYVVASKDNGENLTPVMESLGDFFKDLWFIASDYKKLLEAGIHFEGRRDNEPEDIVRIQNDKTQLELEYIGEGWYGDYNREDPSDTPLIRFTASVRSNKEEDWEPMDDASYCTSLPLDTDNDKLGIIALDMFFRYAIVTEDYLNGASVKKLGEELSWAEPSDEYISKLYISKFVNVITSSEEKDDSVSDNTMDIENLKKQLWNLRSKLTADDCEDIFNTLTTAYPVLGGKLWTEKDIAEKLGEEGFSESQKNIDAVREHLEDVCVLNDVTDEEYICFYNAIDKAEDELVREA